MKRDPAIIRSILTRFEAGELPARILKYDAADVVYHIGLMNDAGLVVATFLEDSSGDAIAAHISRITWKGHEFLDVSRNEDSWKKASAHCGESWTYETLFELLEADVRTRLNLPPKQSP